MSKAARWWQMLDAGEQLSAVATAAGPSYCPSDVAHAVRRYAERHGLPVPRSCLRRGSRTVNVYGDPAWLNERVGFGKFKDRTWAQMATAQRRSKEANWLRWMDENLIPGERYPQHRERDERTLERIKYCLRMVEA